MTDIYSVLSTHLAYILSFVPCLPDHRRHRRPASPPLSAQDGELDSLLPTAEDGWDDAELDDILGSKPRTSPAARWTTGAAPLPPRSTRTPGAPASSGLAKGTVGKTVGPTESLKDREASPLDHSDAKALDPSAIDRLARQWEGGLTAEEMQREEEELARREEQGKHNILRRDGRYTSPGGEEEDEFGGFHQATGPTDST